MTNYVKLVTEATICVRFAKLSRKPQIISFITVPTLDNSGQILHHTGCNFCAILAKIKIKYEIESNITKQEYSNKKMDN